VSVIPIYIWWGLLCLQECFLESGEGVAFQLELGDPVGRAKSTIVLLFLVSHPGFTIGIFDGVHVDVQSGAGEELHLNLRMLYKAHKHLPGELQLPVGKRRLNSFVVVVLSEHSGKSVDHLINYTTKACPIKYSHSNVPIPHLQKRE